MSAQMFFNRLQAQRVGYTSRPAGFFFYTVDYVDKKAYITCISFSPLFRNRKILLLLVIAFPILYYIWSRLIQRAEPNRGVWDDHPAYCKYASFSHLQSSKEFRGKISMRSFSAGKKLPTITHSQETLSCQQKC